MTGPGSVSLSGFCPNLSAGGMKQCHWRLGLQSLCENSKSLRFCSARLQAGVCLIPKCPPKGGRYMIQNRVLTRALKPSILGDLNGRAEARSSENRKLSN